MGKDKLFNNNNNVYDFEFNETVATVFDDMVSRSIPFYNEMQRMSVEIAENFVQPNTSVYDLGCSTGTTIDLMSKQISLPGVKFVGIDNSKDMIDKAIMRIKQNPKKDNINFVTDDFIGSSIHNASVVNMAFTLQFVRPLYRDVLIKKIYNGLTDGGVFIAFEKVLSDNSLLNRTYIDFYYDYKKRKDYSQLEISKKREALENVLIPYRVSENIEIFKRNGFEVVDVFFRWYNWAGFICLKHKIEGKIIGI